MSITWVITQLGMTACGGRDAAPEPPPPATIAAPVPKPVVMPPRPPNTTPDDTGFAARIFERGTKKMPYRLFVPADYAGDRLYPLIVWLHGASGRGTDNRLQVTGDQTPGTHLWLRPDVQAAHPAFVVAPQTNQAWNATERVAGLQQASETALDLVTDLTKEFTIDSARIYVLGQSMGGSAAWNLATNAPDRFAAVVLICPVLPDISRVRAAAHLPFWLFAGETDSLTPDVRALAAALKAEGATPRFTEYPNRGHDIWTQALAEPDLVGWLFAQSRP